MEFYDINNNLVLEVTVDDRSYRIKEIMGDNQLYIYFSSDVPVHFSLFTWCVFKEEKYFLINEENFKKINTRNHEFSLVMDTYQAYLESQKFEFFTTNGSGEVNSDREISFSPNLTPKQYLKLLVDNMNLKDAEKGWKVGDCIEATSVQLDFNDTYCRDALNQIAEAFKTEWEIVSKTIHLRKVEKEKDNPLPLMYDGGLLSGIERSNYKNRIAAVRIKTSDRNIDRSTYGSATLRMPKDYSYLYNGVEYVTDKTGCVLTRRFPLIASPILPEETLDLTHIYPQRVGEVTGVTEVDDSKSLYDIIDKNNPVDYSKQVIEGETMTLIFQDGQLGGYPEFDVKYIEEDKRFEIVPVTDKGINFPQGTLIPAVGDKYAVFNIRLPEEYITDAEKQALEEAVKFLQENEYTQYSYSAKLDELYSKQKWEQIGHYFNPGYYTEFHEPQYLSEPVLIRVFSVKDYINAPYSPEITLSNSVAVKSTSSIINELPNQDQTIIRETNTVKQFTRRGLRDARELSEYIQSYFGYYFSEGINPSSVSTMQLIAGHETLQFRFVNNKTNPVEIDHDFYYDKDQRLFSCSGGIIQHMTLGIDTISPSHSVQEYKFWDMSPLSYTLSDDRPRWLYAKCSKTDQTGSFLMTTEEIQMNDDPSYYHFVVGFLNSPFEGDRSFATMYGYTEILPGLIRVNRIISPDGTQYWDMVGKKIYFGDRASGWSYNVDMPNRFVIRGGITQSPSGDEDFLPVDRGEFNLNRRYYPGDTVKYSGNVYKCILESIRNYPTNSSFWKQVVSKGDDGKTGQDGQGYLYAYYPSDSLTPPSRPSNPGVIPSGWWTYPNIGSYRYLYVSQCIKTNGSWGQWSNPVIYSVKAEDGDPGPSIVFRGDYTAIVGNKIFYNNAARRDVVKYNTTYYIYKGTDGATNNSWVPGNWETFGAQFSSVATDLLFTPNGNVGGWIFKNEYMESQTGGAFLNGKTGEAYLKGKFSTSFGGKRIEIDPVKQTIDMYNSRGHILAHMGFYEVGPVSAGQISSFNVDVNGNIIGETLLQGGMLQMKSRNSGSFPDVLILTEGDRLQMYLNRLPTSRNNATVNTLYLDGETIKMRLS